MIEPSSAGRINARISGIGMHVPEKVLTSTELARQLNLSEEWIITRVGIHERHIAAEGQSASDLGAIAAERAMEDAGVSPDDIDLLIVATQSPDRPTPSTACILQDRLKLSKAAAFDINAACSGFVYALTVGSQFIGTGAYRNILVVAAEVVSPCMDWSDASTCILVGDGAGAVVLQPTTQCKGILAWKLGSDGSGGDAITILAGGSQMPITHEAIDANLHKVKMSGLEIFMFALRTVPAVTAQVLEMAGLSLNDVALFIPHQANSHIVEAIARRMELPPEKFMLNLGRYGNTIAASIPIALYEARETGRIKPGDIVVLTGFGAGLTWGSVVIHW